TTNAVMFVRGKERGASRVLALFFCALALHCRSGVTVFRGTWCWPASMCASARNPSSSKINWSETKGSMRRESCIGVGCGGKHEGEASTLAPVREILRSSPWDRERVLRLHRLQDHHRNVAGRPRQLHCDSNNRLPPSV